MIVLTHTQTQATSCTILLFLHENPTDFLSKTMFKVHSARWPSASQNCNSPAYAVKPYLFTTHHWLSRINVAHVRGSVNIHNGLAAALASTRADWCAKIIIDPIIDGFVCWKTFIENFPQCVYTQARSIAGQPWTPPMRSPHASAVSSTHARAHTYTCAMTLIWQTPSIGAAAAHKLMWFIDLIRVFHRSIIRPYDD